MISIRLKNQTTPEFTAKPYDIIRRIDTGKTYMLSRIDSGHIQAVSIISGGMSYAATQCICSNDSDISRHTLVEALGADLESWTNLGPLVMEEA